MGNITLTKICGKDDPTFSELAEKGRVHDSLAEHIRKVFNYELRPHQLPWIAALEDMSIKRLIIIAPPKYGKTPTMQDYVSWRIGKEPNDYHCLYISNTQSQAIKPSIAIRDTIEYSEEYQRYYPIYSDKGKGWSSTSWFINRWNKSDKDPTFQAAGVHGPVIGATVQEVILDDVADKENQATEYQADKLLEWLRSTPLSRLVPGVSRVVMICTRWSEMDPAEAFRKDGWAVLELPAITDEGELTYPDFWDTEALAQARIDLGPKMFELMFQQNIISSEDQIFKKEYWVYYDLGVLPKARQTTIVQSWDTAFGEKDLLTTSRTACTTWAILPDGYYLLDVWTGRPAYPALKQAVIDQQALWDASVVLIENKASGASLIEDLKETTRIPVVAINPTQDKVARANSVTGMLESGLVKIPKQAIWRKEFELEHERFPSAKLKDIVDTTTQFLRWARKVTAEVSRPSGAVGKGPRGED